MDFMLGILNKFLSGVLSLFPQSPFAGFIADLDSFPYLGYINWFFPISEMISIASLWLTAIALYYAWSVIARWVKLIS